MVQHFKFDESELKGAFIIHPFIATDERGSFIKDYSLEVFQNNGINHSLKEVFYTYSKKGVIRAIHFQNTKEQAKLVRCISGKIYDVIVDLRQNSPTFGKWKSYILSEENQLSLYIPEHFGHGYLVLEPSIVSYQCSEKFYGEFDDGIIWNDQGILIDWPVHLVEEIILSTKDQNLQTFAQFQIKRYVQDNY
jgi:dTDP-4-dehydrorhamnose 3,5-epimerase